MPPRLAAPCTVPLTQEAALHILVTRIRTSDNAQWCLTRKDGRFEFTVHEVRRQADVLTRGVQGSPAELTCASPTKHAATPPCRRMRSIYRCATSSGPLPHCCPWPAHSLAFTCGLQFPQRSLQVSPVQCALRAWIQRVPHLDLSGVPLAMYRSADLHRHASPRPLQRCSLAEARTRIVPPTSAALAQCPPHPRRRVDPSHKRATRHIDAEE